MLRPPVVFFILWTITLTPAASSFVHGNSTEKPQLVVIMIDAFRWDYYNKNRDQLPGFTRFLSQGVQAQWIQPVFPPMSFPNWATLTTGVYPEVHQFIGNNMLDLKEPDPSKRVFNYEEFPTTRLLKWWQEVEPIWTSMVKYGKRSFVRFWPGCDVPYHGVGPTECVPYGGEKTFNDTQETFNAAMRKLEEGFDLVMGHIDIVDHEGHDYGPDSPELLQLLKLLDNTLSHFMDELGSKGLDSGVNMILVSDHGMTYIGPGSGLKEIHIPQIVGQEEADHFVDLKWSRMWFGLPKAKVLPVYERLKKVEGLEVYLRSEIPAKWGVRNAKYAFDILAVAKKGYILCGYVNSSKQEPKWPSSCITKGYIGIHGYSPEMVDMRGIFYARGPAFKKGFVNGPINMVDVYQMYGKLLDVPLHPHNGSWSKVAKMFVGSENGCSSASSQSRSSACRVMAVLVLVFFTVEALKVKKCKIFDEH